MRDQDKDLSRNSLDTMAVAEDFEDIEQSTKKEQTGTQTPTFPHGNSINDRKSVD
jgi:hypothetical protein